VRKDQIKVWRKIISHQILELILTKEMVANKGLKGIVNINNRHAKLLTPKNCLSIFVIKTNTRGRSRYQLQIGMCPSLLKEMRM